MGVLFPFPVPDQRQPVEEEREKGDDPKVSPYVRESRAFQVDHPDHLHEIAHRVKQRQSLRPLRHAVDRRKETAQEGEDDQEEEGGEHRLLLRRRD